MRNFFRAVLLAMVLLTVAVMSALTAMRVAIHGREVAVPNFVKMSAQEAERTAAANGLLYAMEGQFYSADVPEGHIVSQQPEPGSKVRRGWRVRLAQSLGPQRTVIPDVVGESSRAAELNLKRRGLDVGTIATARIPGQPEEQVVAQSPPANAIGVASPKISLLVTLADEPQPMVMPNFIGRQVGEATAIITQAGFKVAHVRMATSQPSAAAEATPNTSVTATPPLAPNTVVRQFPAAGQKVLPGASIDLEISR